MDKRFRIICFLLAVVMYTTVKGQEMIPFAQGVSHEKEMKLSDIASEVQYIPLETTGETLLDGNAIHLTVTLTGNYLFVRDGNHIYQFTPEGKYIRKIGQRGQGPGEFRKHILAVVYDEKKEHIIATDYMGNKAIVFSFEGKYLYDFKIKEMGLILAFSEPDQLYGFTEGYLFSKDRTGADLFLMDDKGKTLKEFRFNYIEGKKYPPIIAQGLFYSYRGYIYYKNPFENQIFRIEGKKKIPAYELDLGAYTKYEKDDPQKILLDKDKGVGTAITTDAGKKRFTFLNLFETDAHLYVRYWQDEEWRLGLYDKRTRKVSRIHASEMKEDGFTDDMEGGMPFIPVQGNGKVLINIIPAESLLEKIHPSVVKGSLKKVMANLQEDDNPVLQIVTLK